jgi:hypothetical protein
MFWSLSAIFLILWLLGLLGHVGGVFIHLLFVIAVLILVINFIIGRPPLYSGTPRKGGRRAHRLFVHRRGR